MGNRHFHRFLAYRNQPRSPVASPLRHPRHPRHLLPAPPPASPPHRRNSRLCRQSHCRLRVAHNARDRFPPHMLPLQIADVTAVLRVSGRRICCPGFRRPSAPRNQEAAQSSSQRFHPRSANSYSTTTTAAPTTATTAAASRHTGRCPSLACVPKRCTPSRQSRESPIDTLFVNALVRAGLCRIHAARYHGSAPLPSAAPDSHESFSLSSSENIQEGTQGVGISMAEFRDPSEYVGSVPERFRPTLKYLAAAPDHPSKWPPIAGPSSQSLSTNPLSRAKPISKEERLKLKIPWLFPENFEEAMLLREFRRSMRDPESTNETIFKHYRKIPRPRIPYLDRFGA